ncbi:MAG: cupredoxin family copper-binding protein [Mycobacterium sp.]|nr:cupredoxin family copper-binding protein [Mycobacterium sp.]
MHPPHRAALVFLGVAAAVAACSAPGSSAPLVVPASVTTATSVAPVAGSTVNISDMAFAPPALSVKVGQTVTWVNHDEEPHTIAAGDGSFHSPGMAANGVFSFTFTKPGTYDYVCSIHPFMHGSVTVTP